MKARDAYKKQYDSIKFSKIEQDFPESDRRSPMPDSLQLYLITREDSLAIAEEILSSTDFPPEYNELIENPIEPPSSDDYAKTDSVLLADALSVLENEAKKFMPDEFGDRQDPLANFQNPAAEVEQFSLPARPNPNLVKPDNAKKLFKKIDPEQLQNAQQ
ncbi:MAG: hypothetical protein HRT61_03380 [Ekhidna sp.]|nr:hypothetical protein [Ekhidna sp.]